LILSLILFLYAGVPDDITLAANRDLPAETREAAYARIIASADVAALQKIGADLKKPVAERWVAIRSLGPIQTLEAQQALVEFMSSSDVWARIASVGALGDRGDRAMAGRVAARLTDPAILVRAAAAETLGKLKDSGTLGDLERALQDPSGWYRGSSLWVRRKYVEAMVQMGKEASPYLARALSDKDPVVVEAALSGLEYISGISFHEGRSPEEEKEAWRRWAGVKR
jgi:HEAT repeat protein